MTALRDALRSSDGPLRAVLEDALSGREVSVEQALVLDGARGRDLWALCATADALRACQAGDDVHFVVNRNINFTNVCVKACRFCAFSRDLRSEQGYLLPTEEIVRRALEARALGASEVCLQAGLLPEARGRLYLEVCRAVHEAAPDLHIHAFSPEEVKYGAALSRRTVRDYLQALMDVGLGSLPGTSAEILDDRVRDRISPGRIRTGEWIEIVTTAHALGLKTTATLMFGHVERPVERYRHLALLRTLQQQTGGFTEFVPLSFVHAEAPLFLRDESGAVQPGPGQDDVVRLYAIARLMLGDSFRNLQASWVKEGLALTERLLHAGVNDVGGTLMNESISTAAGARHGQLVTPRRLRAMIRRAGRTPVERSTLYAPLRRFDDGDDPDPEGLDAIEDAEATFGSYAALVDDPRFRYEFQPQRRASRLPTLA